MTLLVLSPDFASHYGPLAVVATAARASGQRVVVATGHALRGRVEADGFEWSELRLGESSNDGVANRAATRQFLDATRAGPIATIRHQAVKREHDLLWNPIQVAAEVGDLVDVIEPDEVLVDHVSFGSTLAMHATGRPFVTLVPGHPSQLPVAGERYGIPERWPSCFDPDPEQLADLERLADRVTGAFTDRWNSVLDSIAPGIDQVADAVRVHGRRVLYNSVAALQAPDRGDELPVGHRFVGPLVRAESLPDGIRDWLDRGRRPLIYAALGTFLSQRDDVLATIAAAARESGARLAIAIGSTPRTALGNIPDDWLVARELPQVALLPHADVAIHHGGNNSVQESLASGSPQLILPFSTDQFANAADLERAGAATVMAPNELDAARLAQAVSDLVESPAPCATEALPPGDLLSALFD